MFTGSLLPEYRGAAPIQWSVLNGDTKTGITIIDIVSKLDAGDMILKKEIDITIEDTTASMFEKLAILGKECLVDAVKLIEEGKETREKQDEEKVTYAPMLEKEMANIDFSENAEKILNKVRGMNGIFTARAIFNEIEYKIWKVAIFNFDKIDLEKIKKFEEDKKAGEFDVIDGRLFVKANDKAIEILEIQAPSKKKMTAKEYLRGSQI